MIVVFNWLCLRSYELDDYKWKIWHYLIGIWSLYFIATVIYGAVNIILPAIEYDFISTDTLNNLILTAIISLAVIFHFIFYFLRNLKS